MEDGKQIIGLALADPSAEKSMAAHLARWGYETCGFDAHGESKPVAFIVDAASARKMGERLLEIKREAQLFLPVLIILEKKDEPFEPWLELGYDDFLRHPVSEEELQTRLQVLLGIRRRSEQFSLDCERKHRTIFETTGAATLIVGPDGTIQMANRECLQVTGYSSEELVGTKWMGYVAPESLPMMMKYHQLRREDPDKAPSSYVAKFVDKAGRVRDGVIYGRIIPDTKQSVITIVDVTELRQKDETILELGQRWQRTFDSIQNPIWISDKDFRIVQHNAAAKKLWQRAASEVEGRPCWEIVHGTAGPPPGCPGMSAAQSGVRKSNVFEIDGRVFEDVVDPVFDESGCLSSLIHVLRDITDSVRLNENLRRAEENFHRTLDESPIGVRIVTLDDRTLYANPSYLRMFGYENLEELSVTPPVRFYTPASYRAYLERQSLRLQGEPGPSEYEIEIRRKDGSLRALKVFRRPIQWNGEQHHQILYEDITATREAEQAYHKLVTQFQAITDAIEDSLTLISDDSRILWVNRANLKWLQKQEAEIIGRKCYEVRYNRQEPCSYCAVRKVFESGEPQQATITVSSGRIIEIRAFPIREGGRITSVIEVGTDRTDYKRLEAQYLQAQKMEAVGRLAGGVAHDFNNMLSIINGYAELLFERMDAADPLRAHVTRIIEAGRRSVLLTQKLLALSRKQTLQPEVVDLNGLLRDMEDMLRRIIGEDIKLRLMLTPDLARVLVDPTQVEQVILNLVVNARDAMPQGGQLLLETANVELDEAYARAHEGVMPGSYVMLAVSDTGCGMTAETMSKIFDPFFTTKPRGQGTGLGLAMVHGIVRQSGGNICVYSEVGRGTTFKIYFPQSEESFAAAGIARGEAAARGRGEKILVVEDETPLLELMLEVLGRLGYRAQAARGPIEALAMVEKGLIEPDLVITDVVMPEMNGKVLVERLRQMRPNLKVLFISGYTDNVIVHHGVLDEDAPFLQKPFRVQELARKLESILYQS